MTEMYPVARQDLPTVVSLRVADDEEGLSGGATATATGARLELGACPRLSLLGTWYWTTAAPVQ